MRVSVHTATPLGCLRKMLIDNFAQALDNLLSAIQRDFRAREDHHLAVTTHLEDVMYRPLLVVARRVVLSSCAAVLFSCIAHAQEYSVTDLGQIGGYAVNGSGEVAGAGGIAGPASPNHAFLWISGRAHDLGVLPGGHSSRANAIDNSGQVAGTATDAAYNDHAFFTAGPSMPMQNLGTLHGWPYSEAFAINSSAEVVGDSASPNGGNTGFWWTRNTGMRPLHALIGGRLCRATAINDLAQIVGYSDTSAGRLVWHACLWPRSTWVPEDLGTLPRFDASFASGINRSGQIVGESATNAGLVHAFIWSKQTGMVDLGTLDPNGFSTAKAINDSGEVVGIAGPRSTNWFDNPHAFVWTKTAGMKNLNSMIPSGSGWDLQTAYAINSKGEITGYGTLHGRNHGFLLIPTR
jgi:probable HAF family extracellular repeat protein